MKDSPAPGPDELAPEPPIDSGENEEVADEETVSRGHDARIVTEAVEAVNAFIGSHVTIAGDIVGEGSARVMFPTSDISASVASTIPAFVEPSFFADFVATVERDHLVLLVGNGCGKRTAAGVALHRAGHTPILQVPADFPTKSLVDGIERLFRKSPKAGVLIESVGFNTLSELAGFELQRLRGVVSGGSAVVLTARTPLPLASGLVDLPTVEGTPPEAKRVVEVIADAQGMPWTARSFALEALELLAPPVSPSTAVSLIQAARTSRGPPEELAARVDATATDNVLDGWLSKGQSADHVASLAAAAVLDGNPSSDVDAEAIALSQLLGEEPSGAASEPKLFRTTGRGWPAEIVKVTHQPFNTHFGSQETEVVEICPPHTRDRVITYLWRRLGADFRRPFVLWLHQLPAHRSASVRMGAAVAAGILFVEDPIIVERELLRAWALDGSQSPRAAAGLALGVPAAFGADPAPARALAHAWGTGPDSRLRHAAVVAYGGPLGAWDPGSAAPAHLWRIGGETPELENAANVSLASLVAAGAEAGRVRDTVLVTLLSQTERRPPPRRAYGLLPLLLEHLTARGEVARASLVAILGDPERTSLSALAALLAKAFDAPRGNDSACAALGVLLRALAESRVDDQAVMQIVSEMKSVASSRGRLTSFHSQLTRALRAHSHRRGPLADGAQLLLARVSSPT